MTAHEFYVIGIYIEGDGFHFSVENKHSQAAQLTKRAYYNKEEAFIDLERLRQKIAVPDDTMVYKVKLEAV